MDYYRKPRSEIYVHRRPKSEIYIHRKPYNREVRRVSEPRVVQYITRGRPRPKYVIQNGGLESSRYVVRDHSPEYVIRKSNTLPYVISKDEISSTKYVTKQPYGYTDRNIIVTNGHRSPPPRYVTDENIIVTNGYGSLPRPRYGTGENIIVANGHTSLPRRYITDKHIVSNGNTSSRYVAIYEKRGPRLLTALELDLYKRYKPIFDRHEPDGVPLGLLKEELKDEGITDHIPESRLNNILTRADRDGDERIDFVEFMKMMTTDVTKAERTAFQNVIGAAVADILPKSMREDFLANYTCMPPPIFMIFISLVEIIIFAVYAAELSDTSTPVTSTSGVPTYSPLIYKPKRRYEAWRYITYMFIHQGYLHIIFNLIFQLLLGLPLELVHKFWRVMLIYVLGVIAGSLAHSITDVNVALAGASGGCYALIGAHIASVIVNWKEMNYQCTEGSLVRFLCSAPVRLTVLLVLAFGDTGMAIYRRYFEEEVTKVGISAHIGGMLAGLLLGIPILKNVNVLTWEKTLGYVTLAIYLAFVGFAMIFNGVYKGYPETDWSKCCP